MEVAVRATARELAVRHNAVALGEADRKLTAMLRARSTSATSKEMQELVRATKSLLGELGEKAAEAKAFMASVAERKSQGVLDEDTARAELALPKMLVALYATLEAACEVAARNKDNYSLVCVKMAAERLLMKADSPAFLRAVTYPKNDAGLSNSLALGKLQSAETFHCTIAGLLDNAPQALGVRMASFQEIVSRD